MGLPWRRPEWAFADRLVVAGHSPLPEARLCGGGEEGDGVGADLPHVQPTHQGVVVTEVALQAHRRMGHAWTGLVTCAVSVTQPPQLLVSRPSKLSTSIS